MDFTDIVSGIASKNWGRDFATSDEAEKALVGDKAALTAFASVELLRRLDVIASALGRKQRNNDSPRIYTPQDAVKLEGVSVGDRLYEYSTEEGLAEFIVVAKSPEELCLMVRADDFDLKYGPTTRLADKDTKRTAIEAMRHGALAHLDAYEQEVEFAKRLRDAIDGGLPLQEFESGFDNE